MQNANYYILVDGLAATRSVFKDLLRLVQINQGLFGPLNIDALFGIVAQLYHSVDELF